MRLFRSKLFWGVICIALAAVIAFMVLPMFFREQSKTATVLKLSRDVPRGTVLTKAMLTSTEVGAYGLPEQFLSKEEDVAGMVAADDLYAGEFVWKDRLMSGLLLSVRKRAPTCPTFSFWKNASRLGRLSSIRSS